MTEPQTKPTRFYGPVMVGVALLVTLASLPGQTIVIGLFNQPIRESLGLSVLQISWAYTIGTLAAAAPLQLVGRLADRLGVRSAVGIVTVGFTIAMALTPLSAGTVSLTVAFFFLRFLGQGSLAMLGGHILAMWYERKLGMQESVRHVGMALGSGVAPLLVLPLIHAVGWRVAMLVLAGVIAAIVLPVVLTIFRNRPEDIGQHLDGDPAEHATHDTVHGGPPPRDDPAFTLREALGTRAFWVLLSVMVPHGIIGTALLFHMQTLLQSIGADPANADDAIAPWPVATAAAMLAGGWLADRVPPNRVLPVAALLMGAFCLVIWGATTEGALARWETVGVGMLVFGLAMGLSVSNANPAIARYFGRTHHGSIRGTVSTAVVAGTGAGPLLAGWIYETFDHSFTPLLVSFAIASVPLALIAATLRPPTPPAHGPTGNADPDEPHPPEIAL